MRIIILGSFFFKGGGYTTIIEQLALGLTERGHDVMVLGIGTPQTPHNYPFKLVPIRYEWTTEVLRVLPDKTMWNADRVILALDVPKLVAIATKFISEGMEANVWAMEAIFPIESDPILPEWIEMLGKFKQRYVISRYGVEQCESVGLPCEYIPMGCVELSNPPSDKIGPRKSLKWPVDKTIYLTVAANHERKNLPAAMEAFSRLPEDTHYYILTAPYRTIGGWNLSNLANRFDITDRYNTIVFGVDAGILSTMYWAADVFVLPSQAEGACLPVVSESPAHGLPVICGTWTGLGDVADESWVMPVGYDYKYTFPWGDVDRYMASIDDITENMLAVHTKKVDYKAMVRAALDFTKSKPWSLAVDVIEKGT